MKMSVGLLPFMFVLHLQCRTGWEAKVAADAGLFFGTLVHVRCPFLSSRFFSILVARN